MLSTNGHQNGKQPSGPLQQAKLKLPKEKPNPPAPSCNAYQQAIYIQRLMLWTMGKKSTAPAALARLAIAWAQVEERKRILRGLPLPGQLRPDLDPVQLAKALRRQRDRRQITDVEQVHRASFSEEPEGKTKQEEKPKESLSNQGGDHGVRGGEGKASEGA